MTLKIFRGVSLFCFMLFFVSTACLADTGTSDNFQYSAPLTTELNQNYTSIRLTPEIINKSDNNLSDLLLVSNEQAIPYFINSYSIAKNTSVSTYNMEMADSYIKDSFQFLDYKMSDEYSSDIIATSISFQALGQFVKDMDIYGSYDGVNWVFIKKDSIYQVNEGSNLSIKLFPMEKYTWYRFRIHGNQEQISFDRVWLEHSLDTISRDSFIETLTPEITIKEDNKITIITLNGLKNIVLSEIEIKTDSMFKRNIYVDGASHTLYNLAFGNKHYRELTIPMAGYQCNSDTLELRISNGDDAPIKIDSISVSYLAYDIVFPNTQEPVTLYFGNKEISIPPQYDIIRYKEHVLAEGYGKASIGEISQLSTEDVKKSNIDYTMIFNITVVAVAILLAFILIVRIKKVK